nr:lamin tail domain-containing protein [Phycisphaerae bacterium]
MVIFRPLERLEPRFLLADGPLITEFMAANSHTLADQDGDCSDWIEIHNPTSQVVQLSGWHLSDKAANLVKWTFPSLTLAPGQSVVVFASEKDRLTGELHTNFKLDAGGEYLALVRPDGATIQQEFSPQFPPQTADVSYGLGLDHATEGYFLTPTPGLLNTTEQVADLTRQIVISEIMYHAPSENPLEEYIELYNRGSAAVDVAGWRVTQGVDYTFGDVSIPAGGYLVLAADAATFSAKYPGVSNVVSGWTGMLSNKGEEIELRDAGGVLIDSVRFADEGDWAQRQAGPADPASPASEIHYGWVWSAGHAGGGKSLELINPLLPNDCGQNWTSSTVDQGTPGQANSVAAGDLAPLVSDVSHYPAIPTSLQTVTVTARVVDEKSGGLAVWALYRLDGATGFASIAMRDDGLHGDGEAGDGVWGAELPAQANGAIVEFYVRASDEGGLTRSWPAPEPAPVQPAGTWGGKTLPRLLYQVDDSFDASAQWTPGSQPVYRLIMTAAERTELAKIGNAGWNEACSDAQMNGTFICIDGTGIQVRYNVGVRNRGNGSRLSPPNNYRVNFVHDRPWQDVTAIDLNARYPYLQALGSALFRLAGLPTADAQPVQVRINGTNLAETGSRMYGSYVALQVFDGDFAAAWFPDDANGNIYRGGSIPTETPYRADLTYRGTNPQEFIDDGFYKQTNSGLNDWSDLIHLTDVLNNAPDATFAQDITEVIDVEQWLRWFAFETLLGNQETNLSNGYGDDYSLFAGLIDTRFRLLPHDMDAVLGTGESTPDVSESIFEAANRLPEIARLLNHPEFVSRYYWHLLDLIETVFSASQFAEVADRLLGSWVPQATLDVMKTFVANRCAAVLDQIPRDFTVTSALPVVNGYPTTTDPLASISGAADAAATRSVLVNGRPAIWEPKTGTWSFGQDGTSSQTLLAARSTWRYLDDGSDQGTAWRAPAFDDSAWAQGAGQLGYGDGDEATTVGYGSDPNNKFITTYFRQAFNVDDAASVSALTLRLLRDDGAIVYLNGVEIARSNMPAGTVNYTTLASVSQGGTDETTYWTFDVDESLLVDGANVLAVEIHQNPVNSSDISFDAELVATVSAGAAGEGVSLTPGINRIFVEAFDGPNGTGSRLDRRYIDVNYDDGSLADVSGTISIDAEWTPQAGPYHVTANLTVAAGATLTIRPGTTVFFEPGTKLIVNGRLDAQGTELARIRFTRTPSAATDWAGMEFTYASYSPLVNTIAHADIEYADSGSQAIKTQDAQLVLDDILFANHSKQYLSLDDSSIRLTNSVLPKIANAEVIHYWGFPDGGYALFDGNYFGGTTGSNDIIDFTGGQRPGNIAQFLNNVFASATDDCLDLDATDAHIEGNLFMHVHQDAPRESLSHGVTTGTEGGVVSQITVVRNLFYDVDHAILIKDGGYGTIINNTIVHATCAAINVYEARSGQWQGDDVYADGNIFYDVAAVFANPDPAGHGLALSVNHSVIYPAVESEPMAYGGVGNVIADPRLVNVTDVTDPWTDFRLRDGSPAIGLGPNGVDAGGVIPSGASIAGAPDSPTTADSVTLTVGGPDIYGYRYRLNGGTWSETRAAVRAVTSIVRTGDVATVALPGHGYADGDTVDIYGSSQQPYNGTFVIFNVTADTFDYAVSGSPTTPAPGALIARRQEPIVLTGLTDGTYQVDVIALNSAGQWQAQEAATSAIWTMDSAPPARLQINEILASNVGAVDHAGTFPDMVELFYDAPPGAPALNLRDMSLSDDPASPRKFVFLGDAVLEPGGYLTLFADRDSSTPGLHLGFALDASGDALYLYDSLAGGGDLLDGVQFGLQAADLSIGVVQGQWQLTQPTFGLANRAQPTAEATALRINEWLASGQVRLPDDFIELYNTDSLPVALGGLSLSDSPVPQPQKHQIAPLSFIAANGFLAFWADGDAEAGPDHLSFKLAANQGMIGLADLSGDLLDTVLYYSQTTDVSQGRLPDGEVDIGFFRLPTPGLKNVVVTATTTTVHPLAMDSTWSYYQAGDAGTTWMQPGFDDSSWPTGQGALALEADGLPVAIKTTLTLGKLTYYFRTHFTLDADPADVSQFQVTTILDDGAVLYLNGTEVLRVGVAAGDVTYSTLASRNVGNGAIEGPFTISTDALVRGDNVLAVEVHQSNSNSSDISFALSMDATVTVIDVQTSANLLLLDGLRVTEIHYQPAEGGDTEFIELKNVGPVTLDLSGVRLTDGIDFTFPDMVLAPDGYVVVAASIDDFADRYGTGINLAGQYSGSLSNTGERITLQLPDPDQAAILRFDYGSAWYPETAGGGYALVIRDETAAPADWDNPDQWQAGAVLGGSPGRDDAGPEIGPVVINEIHHTPDVDIELVEFIELYNTGAASVDLSGWQFTDGVQYTFPAGTVLAGGAYLVVAQSPAQFQAKYFASALGPYSGLLNGDGEEVTLVNAAGIAQDEVTYQLGFPWPIVGCEPGYSMELVNPALDNDLGGSWRAGGPTPGRANSVYAANAAPQMRQLDHSPQQPTSGQSVTVTVKITDPDGVASVSLAYQLVDPGDYIELSDPRYATQWTNIPMRDDGLEGDETAGDSIYTVVLPAALQTNRRLVRYRITAFDAIGLSITAPYADDTQPNFAYYVYDGVPSWTGADQPGASDSVTYDGNLLDSLPIIQLITTSRDHEESQYIPDSTAGQYAGDDYLWTGAIVFDGKVYDHIHFRARGGVWRYAMGKNMWKFDFNRGHSLPVVDDYGRPYDIPWDKLNLGACIQQGDYLYRGEQGLFESVTFKLMNLAGVAASSTTFVHFRIVESAEETGTTQYDGDFQGLYLAIEQYDGNFLDEHDLADGNLYKMESGTGTLNNQGPLQPSDSSDLNAFMSAYNSSPSEQWWRENVDLEGYYSYRSIVEAVHHYDIGYGKNYFYYHDPVTNTWSVFPWDVDLTWANNMYGNGQEPFYSRLLTNPVFAVEYRNRMREIRDLLYNPEQTGLLIDEMASKIYTPGQLSFVDADRAMWDYNPILSSAYVNASKAGVGRFYDISPTGDFAGMIALMKNYVVSRGAWIDSTILTDEALIPATPTVTYTGQPVFPIDELTFAASAFSSASASFAAMEWRIAEVATGPVSADREPCYEITALWTSGELTAYDNDVFIPSGDLEVGKTYRVRVRMKDDAGRYSHWSAPVEFTVTDGAVDFLRVTEVMYNPPEPSAAELAADPALTREDFEFIEILNTGSQTADLTGVAFVDGITFDFTGSQVLTLEPGQYVLVVRNRAAFELRYGTQLNVAGQYGGGLDDGGETLALAAFGRTLFSFTYNDSGSWPGRADGRGSSLEVVDPA